jgi:hypothetical protein
LAGQFFGHFLGFGSLFNDLHLDRALEQCVERLEREWGVANLMGPELDAVLPADSPERLKAGWPAHSIVHLDSLLVRRGREAAGYRLMEKHFGSLRRRRDLLFETPLLWDLEENDAFPGTELRHRSLLGIWHALFAMQGFFYDAVKQKMSIVPRLPAGMTTLSTPLFTAFALGWLRHTEQWGKHYTQQVDISFESPVWVQTLELGVPREVEEVAVVCELPTGEVAITHEVVGEEERRVVIRSPRVMSISGTLSVRLRAVVAPPADSRTKHLFR